MPEMAHIFKKESCMPNRIVFFNVDILGPSLGFVLAISTISLLLDAWNSSKFLMKSQPCQILEYSPACYKHSPDMV